MMRQSIMAGMLLAVSAAWAGGIPYSPAADVPDYIATMTTEQSWGKPAGPQRRIVTHHGGWVRIDEPQATTYGNLAKHISITIRRHPEARYSSIQIYRSSETSDARIFEETGETETHAGERCTVREVLRGNPDKIKNGPKTLSCLTADGIEIGSKVLGSGDSPMEQSTLVGLERRPVSAEDVTPPADLFDVVSWLNFDDQAEGAATVERPDYALHMHSEDAIRIVRRHAAWTYDERSYPDGRRNLAIWNSQTGQYLSFHTEKGGAFVYLVMREKHLPGERISLPPFGPMGTPKRTGKQSSVLGQPCAWFDVWPNMADASLHYCLTQDGIPVRIRSGGGFKPYEEFVADEVLRRDLKPEEILPPADVLTRSNWDIPG